MKQRLNLVPPFRFVVDLTTKHNGSKSFNLGIERKRIRINVFEGEVHEARGGMYQVLALRAMVTITSSFCQPSSLLPNARYAWTFLTDLLRKWHFYHLNIHANSLFQSRSMRSHIMSSMLARVVPQGTTLAG
jgi:hypothetical protein